MPERESMKDQINVRLDDEARNFLKAFADAHYWKTGQLARLILEEWIASQRAAGVSPESMPRPSIGGSPLLPALPPSKRAKAR